MELEWGQNRRNRAQCKFNKYHPKMGLQNKIECAMIMVICYMGELPLITYPFFRRFAPCKSYLRAVNI
jgi:hypothetical protein